MQVWNSLRVYYLIFNICDIYEEINNIIKQFIIVLSIKNTKSGYWISI